MNRGPAVDGGEDVAAQVRAWRMANCAGRRAELAGVPRIGHAGIVADRPVAGLAGAGEREVGLEDGDAAALDLALDEAALRRASRFATGLAALPTVQTKVRVGRNWPVDR